MNGDGWGDFACYFNTRDTTFALFHPQPGSYLDDYQIYKGNFAAMIPQAYHSGRPALVLAYRNVFSSLNTLYVHLGGNGLDTIPDGEFSLPELLSMSTPAYAGDVNADGWGDWLAGSDGNFGGLGAFLLFLGGPRISNYSYWMVGAQGQDYWAMGKAMTGVGDVNGDGVGDFAMLCSRDTTGHGGSQLVVFAGDPHWSSVEEERPPLPLKSSVVVEAFPNPAQGEVQIAVKGLPQGQAIIEVWNILGQRVWRREVQSSAGRLDMVWRREDEEGRKVAAGVYFAQVIQRNTSLARQKILITN